MRKPKTNLERVESKLRVGLGDRSKVHLGALHLDEIGEHSEVTHVDSLAVHELGEEGTVGEDEDARDDVVNESGEDGLAEPDGGIADGLGRLGFGVVDDGGGLAVLGGFALDERVRVEREVVVGREDDRRSGASSCLVDDGSISLRRSLLELRLDGASSDGLFFRLGGDLGAGFEDARLDPGLQLGIAVCLEEFGAEEDEAMGVVGGRVDAVRLACGRVVEEGTGEVVLEELDVDAVEADCGAKNVSIVSCARSSEKNAQQSMK